MTIEPVSKAYRLRKSITYNNVKVELIMDKPVNDALDVLLTFHGTVQTDDNILAAAENTLNQFKSIVERQDMMIVSVAHSQRNILFGDNIEQAEAALLWVKNQAGKELGITVKKIFLAGHSQGGYLVTRLNTMYKTNGVIANAPGPLNLVFRCQLEENGKISSSYVCDNLRKVYGPAITNAEAYFQRSLLNFTNDFKSDILFIQGLNDSAIQLYSWPTFKDEINACKNCKNRQFSEIENGGHAALFESQTAKSEFNHFIQSH